MNPKLRKRFVDSIEYLRKMDFFRDYSNLSSEEIFDRILNGEMEYMDWWEEWKKEHPVEGGAGGKSNFYPYSHGSSLLISIEKNQASWMKKSDAKIDYEMIQFDTKRVMVEDPETRGFIDEMGIAIINRLSRISRGIFQPISVSSRWTLPPELKWCVNEVSFDYKGRRHTIQIVLRHDFIEDMGLRELNEIIEDTGYQYYQINERDVDYYVVVVLTKEEAEKLERERGWSFEYLY
ncbi:MAG: hypothetical protein QXI42_06560 [Thermoproteota archaeon]|nr:hypothetical protein [Candidatus Brockarchaeota archaeon]